MKKPTIKQEVLNVSELKKAVKEYMDGIEAKDPYDEPNDDEIHKVFEKAIELFYGENVWNWVNTKLL